MPRSTEETARWCLTSSLDPRMVRSRIAGIDDIDELRTWLAVYNQVREQLPPGRRDLIDALDRRAESLREE